MGRNHIDGKTIATDLLARTNFAGFTQLRQAIDRDHALGDQMLGGAAAIGHAADLKQITQSDIFITYFKGFIHFHTLTGQSCESPVDNQGNSFCLQSFFR